METPEGTTEAATASNILEHGHAVNDADTEQAELIAAYVVTCLRRGPASTLHVPIPSLLLGPPTLWAVSNFEGVGGPSRSDGIGT